MDHLGGHDALKRYHRDLAVIPVAVLVTVGAGDDTLAHPGGKPIALGAVRNGGGTGPVLFATVLHCQFGISHQVALPLGSSPPIVPIR